MSDGHHKHFILPVKMALIIAGCLFVLTWVTVAIADVDLGKWNFLVAISIATFKASLVFLFFMGLAYDNAENRVIFASGVIFLGIFIILTSTDLFFRPAGSYVVEGKIFKEIKVAGKGKFSEPWKSTPELLAHAKPMYEAQCAMCHGATGGGDGAAAAALNPRPRNFKVDGGWKNGRKPSQVFGTLTKGLNSMPSFSTLPEEDRWALAHYVLAFGSKPPADSSADLSKVGAGGSGPSGPKEISIDQAIETMAID